MKILRSFFGAHGYEVEVIDDAGLHTVRLPSTFTRADLPKLDIETAIAVIEATARPERNP